MSETPVEDGRQRTWSPETLDRAFVTAYAVALAGSLAVSVLTYAYVAPGVPNVREANPVTAAIIAWIGLEWTVWIRTVVIVVGYWSYAYVRATTCWSELVVVFAWLGAAVQVSDLLVDLHVVALVGPPPASSLVAAFVVVAPALVAGVVLRPPEGLVS